MKYPTDVALAYCTENQAEANEISAYLSPAVSFQHFHAGNNEGPSLAAQMQSFNGTILLLISDNFLHSVGCLHEALTFINNSSNEVLPVIIDGSEKDERTGQLIPVSTSIERNKDIIQYISFWQDRYLDLRKQKREDPDLDNEGFERYLKKVRAISSDIGEFIRVLKSAWHLREVELKVNEYEQLFLFLEAEEIGATFRSYRKMNPMVPPSISVVEEEENAEILNEELNVDLADIPGISLLETDTSASEDVQETAPDIEAVIAQEVFEELAEPPAEEQIEEAKETEAAEKTEEATAEEQTAIETETIVTETATQEEEEEKQEEEEEEEEEVTETAASITQEDALALATKAWDLAEQGNVKAGLILLDTGIENYAVYPLFRYHKALMLAQENEDLDAAKTEIDLLLAAHPDHQETLLLAGEIADIQEEPAHAREYFEKVAQQNSRHPEIWYKLGVLTLQNFPQEKEEAFQYFRKAVKRNSAHVDAVYQLAVLTKEHAEKTKKAKKLFKKVVKLAPTHPFAHYDLALLYHGDKRYDIANEFYQTAASINPELKTEQNDAAFTLAAREMAAIQEEEQSTLLKLKKNIEHLEALLKEQEQSLETPAKIINHQLALVTGATSGIGRATVEALAEAGYRVIITGRREERLAEVQAHLEKEYGVDILSLSFDVRNAEEVQQAIDSLPEEWATIDLLINNAGKAKGLGPIQDGNIAHWEEMIDTNVKGLLYLTRAVSPDMVARQSGHIINVCSTAGKEVYPNGNVYCATKHAVDALTKAMRIDLHQHNVRVSQISPAHVEETEFALVRFDGDVKKAKIYDDFQPLKSSDIGRQIVFIASQPAHVNILDIVVQGTQQAHSMIIDRSGRNRFMEEE